MFTGLIEAIGTVRAVAPFSGGRRFEIEAPGIAQALHEGDSVACLGICLTVESSDRVRGRFTVAAVGETLARTTASRWRPGRRLHLERALSAGDRLGGHFVQGHIDATARVVAAGKRAGGFRLSIRLPRECARYVVAKGPIAIDGVSLTVARVTGGVCEMAIIPETLARTIIGSYRSGGQVNLEVDLMGKYAESLARVPKR